MKSASSGRQHQNAVTSAIITSGHADESPWQRRVIILAVLTAIEVGMYFLEGRASNAVLYIGLTVLMVVKFFMVVAYYMHLKYDTPWFRRIFVAGLVLAMGVYAIFFFAYDVFGLG